MGATRTFAMLQLTAYGMLGLTGALATCVEGSDIAAGTSQEVDAMEEKRVKKRTPPKLAIVREVVMAIKCVLGLVGPHGAVVPTLAGQLVTELELVCSTS